MNREDFVKEVLKVTSDKNDMVTMALELANIYDCIAVKYKSSVSWKETEIQELMSMHAAGHSYVEIAKKLNKPLRAVGNKIYYTRRDSK